MLVINPLTAILLILRVYEPVDFSHIPLQSKSLISILNVIGLLIYILGFFLMAWALVCLGSNYQLGGISPRKDDSLVVSGCYQIIRNPMYTAALSISLGLALLFLSGIFLGVFGIYLVLILLLIPEEEKGLRNSYDGEYLNYYKRTKRLVPFLF